MTARKHKWNPPRTIVAHESPDGCERHIRTCSFCPVICTTVIPPRSPPFPWREYQLRETGPVSFSRIECVDAQPVDLRDASRSRVPV
jgi:hypothetical protein